MAKITVATASDIHGMWGPNDLSLNEFIDDEGNAFKPHLDLDDYPKADFLVLAGDILGNYHMSRGDYTEIASQLNELELFNDFCGKLKALGKYREIFFVAGNHGWVFQKSGRLARERLTNVVYLQDESVNIGGPDGGIIKIYGSPWQPAFCDWAFNFPDHNANFFRARAHARACWEQIPSDTQILITHSPPQGILDETVRGMHAGCDYLKERLQVLMHLKLHVFGHIHYSYGHTWVSNTAFVNASVCGEDYLPNNPIQVIEIDV